MERVILKVISTFDFLWGIIITSGTMYVSSLELGTISVCNTHVNTYTHTDILILYFNHIALQNRINSLQCTEQRLKLRGRN